MIEALIIGQMMIAQAEAEREVQRQWWEEYDKAPPEMKSIMLKVRREMEEERKIERRHREQIQAQNNIADAIRYAARPRYY